jgi:hypothetical protein
MIRSNISSHAANLNFCEEGIREAANFISVPFSQRTQVLSFDDPAQAIRHLIEQA